MDFRIADTFTAALGRLPAAEQKAVKVSVMDLQLDPSSPGLQMHRIDNARDSNFWSARVGRDVRLILHKTGTSLLVAYVDHHDAAYAWAERRRIEAHPKTGAVQIVVAPERVEEAEPDLARYWTPSSAENVSPAAVPPAFPFEALTPEALLAIGVPQDWIAPVQHTPEAEFFDLAEHLPAEAGEALLEYLTVGVLKAPEPPPVTPVADPFDHPDARRRFAAFDNADELAAALNAPWDLWSVFLHPSQRAVVDRSYGGPARVSGSAGTGKTVVAVHRAVRLIRHDRTARLLLSTFSEPLAANLRRKVEILAGPDASVVPRVTTASFEGLAVELFQLAFGHRPRIASGAQIAAALNDAATRVGLEGFSPRFLLAEWIGVVDAWRVQDEGGYADVPRLGRKSRLGQRQRETLWPVFASARAALQARGFITWPQAFHALADHYGGQAHKPFSHIVVDEAQDLGVPELRLICALAPPGSDRLFFAGDLGQRIFQQPFSWKALGVDVRGRSSTLKVNYRTSEQIREAADRLLPKVVRDVDGLEEQRTGTISVFAGAPPEIMLTEDDDAEISRVATFLSDAVGAGSSPGEIGVFVRSRAELPRARAAVRAAGLEVAELSERSVDVGDRVALGTMHLAKGLEFKVVAVMACDDGILPNAERIDAVIEETDLDEVYDTERHLLYVACTRARDRLMVSGVSPGSEFIADLT